VLDHSAAYSSLYPYSNFTLRIMQYIVQNSALNDYMGELLDMKFR
jgi:hypothetical protein